MVGQTISHYRVVDTLGAGGRGVVYRAEDLQAGRHVALKIPPPELLKNAETLERVQREVRAASALDHPHICAMYDVGIHDGQLFIVMELLEGVTLKHRIAARAMKIGVLLEVAAQVADALDAAHARNIVHRNITPGNIFLTTRGMAKVLDVGLAELVPRHLPGGGAPEIVAYMSPEQARGEDVDLRTDLFSFGLVLYEMATGRPAFSGETGAGVRDAIINGHPTPPTWINDALPGELVRIIGKALQKDRDLRYQTAAEMRSDLLQLKRDVDSTKVAPVVAPAEAAAPADSSAPVSAAAVAASAGAARPARPAWQRPDFALRALSRLAGAFRQRPLARGRTIELSAAALALAAVVATLVFFNRGPVLADGDEVLVTAFTNTTGDPVFEGALEEALAAAFAQSPFFSVVSWDKVRASLSSMGRGPDERVTASVGREICQRRGIKAMLTGSIASQGSKYLVTLEAAEGGTGDALVSRRHEAERKEDVIAALGQAASALREALGEPAPSIERFNAPLAQATSPSLDALKAYGLASRLLSRGEDSQAVPLFEGAIESDPSFAAAHARLGTTYRSLREEDRAEPHSRRAYELRDRVSEGERYSISAEYFTSATGELDQALRTYDTWKQTYPRSWTARAGLAGRYNDMGEFAKAAEEASEAARLNPDAAAAQLELQRAYCGLGRFAEAKALADKQLAQSARSGGARARLLAIAALQGDAAAVTRHSAPAQGEAETLAALARASAFRGRMAEARELARQAILAAEQRGLAGWSASIAEAQTLAEAMAGNTELARDWLALTEKLGSERARLVVTPFLVAFSGAIERAQALTEEFQGRFPKHTLINLIWLPSARATIALVRREPGVAVDLLSRAKPYERGNVLPIYLRGQAYSDLRMNREAAREFERILELRGVEPMLGPFVPLAHVALGRAYGLTGETDKARRAYESFFALWKDADPDVPLLTAAREEYAALR